jgi:hypothetical protein
MKQAWQLEKKSLAIGPGNRLRRPAVAILSEIISKRTARRAMVEPRVRQLRADLISVFLIGCHTNLLFTHGHLSIVPDRDKERVVISINAEQQNVISFRWRGDVIE